jgi:antitoxin VapB
MATAKVFKSGNSQALRLPKQFRLDSTEVEIFRRGDEIVLREKPRTMARAFEILSSLDLPIVRKDTPPQTRKGL